MPMTPSSPFRRAALAVMGAVLLATTPGSALAQQQPPITSRDASLVVDAREALRKRDRTRLAALRSAALAMQHPLASWVDYWELGNRLYEVRQDELDAFYARWPGSYVEDRLRNDWLLELGRRRDWAGVAKEFPRFRMNDDREVTCHALTADHVAGKPVRDAAWTAWSAQLVARDLDDGCAMLASTMFEARLWGEDELWQGLRLAAEFNRPRAARAIGQWLGSPASTSVPELFDNPARFLARKASPRGRVNDELTTLALMRMAANDPDAAATQFDGRWRSALPGRLQAAVDGMLAKQQALRLQPDAFPRYQRAWAEAAKAAKGGTPAWSDDMLAWAARSALRNGRGAERWPLVLQATSAMSAAALRDDAWAYWRARAQQALAREGTEGDAQRAQARQALQALAGQIGFYPALAAEDLGRAAALPPKPAPPTPAEREAARAHTGLARALLLIDGGLRGEGVREWNFSLRGMGDRELLAAAQMACERELWDRCINTSDRTRAEIDLDQRYPTPLRPQVLAASRDTGIDPAYVYGLIRQESRFIMDARSHVGASGLMQVMPATARWTAKKLGIPYTPELITDRDTNLRIGTGYLKLVLDDFGGSQALAAAAYNAGPGRPRRWREGPALEPAAWAENIPFNETRDYVKRVLSNAMYYQAVLAGATQQPQPAVPALKSRLGAAIGPREGPPNPLDNELP